MELHTPTHTQTARSIAADTADMQHCVTRRTGYNAHIERIIQLPRGLGETALIGTTLRLPEQYAWDIADTGTGRWLRRAAIAAALTRHHLHTHGDLRDSTAAPILAEGLPGAVGLLCVGDSDGLPALTTLLQHHSDTTTQTLAASRIPIGPVLHAPRKDWYADYGPQSLLAFAATLTPSDYAALTDALHHHAGAARPASRLPAADHPDAGRPALNRPDPVGHRTSKRPLSRPAPVRLGAFAQR